MRSIGARRLLPCPYASTSVTPGEITRAGLADKQIGEQLLADIAKYQRHPDVQRLHCIVYDPEGHISNARGLESDLSRVHGELAVRVMIVP